MEPIRLRSDGTLSLFEVMKYKYLDKGWAVEYADNEGNYGMGDPLSGTERLVWEDEGEPAGHALRLIRKPKGSQAA